MIADVHRCYKTSCRENYSTVTLCNLPQQLAIFFGQGKLRVRLKIANVQNDKLRML